MPRNHKAIVYRAGDGWRYRVKAGNGRTVDASEEAFSRKFTAVRRVKKRWPDAEITVER